MRLILDACCGPRMMWFDKENPNVVFGDCRSEDITVTDRTHGVEDGTRELHVRPDIVMDFRAMEFPDGSFCLVVFDPPHLRRAGLQSWLRAKYGILSDDWQDDLRRGFAECFRVLRTNGVLIFKWNETQIKVSEILALTDQAPLFGHRSGKRAGTHWITFMKRDAGEIDTPASTGDEV